MHHGDVLILLLIGALGVRPAGVPINPASAISRLQLDLGFVTLAQHHPLG